jgi:oligopeptide transport system substrate-binding protein
VRTKKLLLLVVGLLGALALAAAGCGGGDEEGGGGGTGTGGEAADQVITIAWGTEPPSLDSGISSDTTSSNIIRNLFDPLVIQDPVTLEAKPNLAESWDISDDGLTVTYHLLKDGKWTNGDPLTARDFEYSWKRTIDPETAAEYAYQFFGIKGALEFNSCEKKCDALRDQVGIKAVDDYTLEVTLTSPQPWFVGQSAHTSFNAVHQATVEQFGAKWTEPQNIVTSGPFKLEKWEHEAEIDLVKWDGWRNADQVKLTRVNGKIIVDGTTRVQAFESGEVDALDGGSLPPDEIARLKETPEFELYPYLGTYYYGFNVKNIPDVHQRRAMSLAIDRQGIIDNIAQAEQVPATGMTPPGIKGQEVINPNSPWLPKTADIDKAKDEMAQAQSPKTDVTLFYNNAPGHKEIATAVQAQWEQLGLKTSQKQQEWAQYLEFIGPPPNSAIDVFRLGWIYDFADAINGLELWKCDSGNNSTNWCNKDYDALVEDARATADEGERFQKYNQLEQVLFGEDGEVPFAPIYWYTLTNLEKLSIKDTFYFGPLNDLDLTKVVVKAT